MCDELKIESILIQIKAKLNTDKIQLWTAPYYKGSDGSSLEDLKRLAADYSSSLTISFDQCLAGLLELQNHALGKLKERNQFKETGVATLKIKVASDQANTKIITFESTLACNASVVKEKVAKTINVPQERIKLISCGKVLVDSESLSSQDVKNGSQIMAVVLHENPKEVEEVGSRVKTAENVKADTELLATDEDSFYMQVEDQFGNTLRLPQHERKALLVAMTLHEKGRSALKKGDLPLALVLFLDADKEFCQCNSQILNSVDNYALLNLDIAWCYLCLKSVSQLPEAEERLKKCEQSFEKSYGKNFERLIALKGTPGNEAALFMRLHLLQAIVLYHKNKRHESLELLLQAESELKSLKVSEESICSLIELGYSAGEARLGLRATHGDVNAAAEHLDKQREQRKESRKKAALEWAQNKERRKLGRCADGKQYVEPSFVKMLQDMGYSKEIACRALQQSNNNVTRSIQIIQDNPELLENVCDLDLHRSLSGIIAELVPKLESAGFDVTMAKAALEKHDGNYFKALEELLSSGGIIAESFDDNAPSTSQARQEDFEEAFKRLSEDMPASEDDHLDLTLEQEELFLEQYKSLLS